MSSPSVTVTVLKGGRASVGMPTQNGGVSAPLQRGPERSLSSKPPGRSTGSQLYSGGKTAVWFSCESRVRFVPRAHAAAGTVA